MTTFKRTIINGEFEIVLPKHRADREEWYTEDGWEKKRLQKMHEVIKKDDLVFYVGSEEGEFPALIQMWGAKTFLFEPNPKVWPNTKGIYAMNHLKDPIGCFVGFAANNTDLKGAKIYQNSFPPCANGEIIGDHGFKELAYESDVIPQVKIDDVVNKYCIQSIPDVISLDVEGSEFEVLRGAEHTLKVYRPKIFLSLHPEFMWRMFNEYSADLRKWIKDIGYKEELLAYDHEVHLYYEKI